MQYAELSLSTVQLLCDINKYESYLFTRGYVISLLEDRYLFLMYDNKFEKEDVLAIPTTLPASIVCSAEQKKYYSLAKYKKQGYNYLILFCYDCEAEVIKTLTNIKNETANEIADLISGV